MAGFAEADGGEIFIDGELVTEIPPYQREIGIVFQNYALFPHMTVEKNVGYGLRMRGVPKAEIVERVEQALALVKRLVTVIASRVNSRGAAAARGAGARAGDPPQSAAAG